MNRFLVPALALAGLGAGCKKEHAAPAPVAEPAPRPVRTACPADAGELPRFTLAADASAADKLTPELLPEPVRGHCEREQYLLAQTESRPRTASTIQTAAGPYLAVHRLHAMAVLPQPKVVLLAAETGLWAHDAETMTRLARLAPHRTVDVYATRDGAYFAYVRQDPTVGTTAPARELVVVETAKLAVVKRIADFPEGRFRLAGDASAVTVALGDDGVRHYDLRTGAAATYHTNDTVEDTYPLPDRPGVVAYVGHDNAVAFHDFRSGAEIPQSTTGQLPLVANRDLLTVMWEPTSRHLLAGGADNFLHVYEDMPGAHPRDVQQVRLRGNVVDVACCIEGALVATTDSVNVVWIKDGAVVREVGPFLPDLASAPARIGIVGDDTVVSMVGRVFTWTRDGFFVQPDFFAGEEIARERQGDDTLVVLRSRGWLEFHRLPSAGGLAVQSTLLGTGDWAIIDASVEAQNGTRVFVGRRHGRMVAAIIPTSGDATFLRGPLVGVHGHATLVPRGDGVHFAMWNLQDQVAELDVAAGTLKGTQRIGGPASERLTLSWAGDRWKIVDETGAERPLTAITETVLQSDLLR